MSTSLVKLNQKAMQLVRNSISYTFTFVAKFSSCLEKFKYQQCKSCQPVQKSRPCNKCAVAKKLT